MGRVAPGILEDALREKAQCGTDGVPRAAAEGLHHALAVDREIEAVQREGTRCANASEPGFDGCEAREQVRVAAHVGCRHGRAAVGRAMFAERGIRGRIRTRAQRLSSRIGGRSIARCGADGRRSGSELGASQRDQRRHVLLSGSLQQST